MKRQWDILKLMKYKIEDIKNKIDDLARDMGQITIMEVCGTHTASIRKYGIDELMPANIRLVSGPGCPVCVTAQTDIASAISLAKRAEVIFTCFGDMMRVPCGEESLYALYESGKDIRIVTSPIDALTIAIENPTKQVIYFAIGFETTVPHTASLLESAEYRGIQNLSIISAHKTMPQAIINLLRNENCIDALLYPGHVASITGAHAFSMISDELKLPGAISGFELFDIMTAILRLVIMLCEGENRSVNMYPRAVKERANPAAVLLINKVFEPCDANWRGLGKIDGSGLCLNEAYQQFDAVKRFVIDNHDVEKTKGCICAEILCGKRMPTDCINFGGLCTPDTPLGACMVSSEGSCSVYYRY